MGRNIVVFADGTGNSAAKAFKTNVWRLYQALDLNGADQIATFADGVGTTGLRPFQIFGLALGFGVKRRVMTLYKFLCLNFREHDRIYIFGFSRGAFTARLLAGFVASEGLVEFNSHEELDRNAIAAYRAYRQRVFPARGVMRLWVGGGRWIRDTLIRAWGGVTSGDAYDDVRPSSGPRSSGDIRIRFLGVWDTVAAYGLPVDEMTKAFNDYVWPMSFDDRTLHLNVETARQAFSLDDERRTFHPIPWDEEATREKAAEAGRKVDLEQVWFAGSHSNVGGGYPDDRLAHLPLCWMIAEAAKAGLRFKPEIVADYWDIASATGRIYDSRAGVSLFYRYHPRSAGRLMLSDKARQIHWLSEVQARPTVDNSVILRMADGADGYAPLSLADDIDVLMPRGDRVDFRYLAYGTAGSSSDPLPLPASRGRDLARLDARARSAIRRLGQIPNDAERDERVALMHDSIWWRRTGYYVLLAFVLAALTFPWWAPALLGMSTKHWDIRLHGIVGPVVGLIEGFAPSFLSPWTKTIALYPTAALVVFVSLAICIWANALVQIRIADRARTAWNVKARKDRVTSATRQPGDDQRWTLAGFIIFALLTLAAIFGPDPVRRNWYLVAGLAVAAAMSLYLYMVMIRGAKQAKVKSPLVLKLARIIRTSIAGRKLYWYAKNKLLPAVFLAVLVVLAVSGANKITYEAASSAGAFCDEPQGTGVTPAREWSAAKGFGGFTTGGVCIDTGIELVEGRTYQIRLTQTEPWWDGEYRAPLVGFASGDQQEGAAAPWIFYAGTPFRRWWTESWFTSIARIGPYGNYEHALKPIAGAEPTIGTTITAEIQANARGRLYIFVNDAVIPVVGSSLFYDGWDAAANRGTALVQVRQVEPRR